MKKVYLIAVIFAIIAGVATYMFATEIDKKTTFKDAKIGVLSVVSSPIFKNFLEEENSYNKLIEEYCQKQNFEFIDMREKMEEIDKEKGAFHMDNIHPNSNGYKYYAKRLFGYEN